MWDPTPLGPQTRTNYVPTPFVIPGQPPAPTPAATSSLGTGLGTPTDSARINLASAPDISTLSDLINSINRTANQSRVPGGAALEQQSSQNIASELAGNLPQSEIDRLRQQASERGLGFGPDSPATQSSVQRQLGVDQLALQRQGQSDLGAAYNRAAPLFDAASQLTTPGQIQQGQEFAQNLAQRQFENANQIALEYARLNRSGLGTGGGGRYPGTQTSTGTSGPFPTWDTAPVQPGTPNSGVSPIDYSGSFDSPSGVGLDYSNLLGYGPSNAVPDLSLTQPQQNYTEPGSLFEQVYGSTPPPADWTSAYDEFSH